jgi:PASTA domain
MALDIPNPFEKLSKPQIYAVIGGSLLLGGYLEIKHHKSTGSWNPFGGSSSSSSASGSAIDPVTNLPYSEDDTIDPITNLPYLQEAEQYGSVAAAEADVSSYGASSSTGSGVGVSPASGTGSDGTSTTATGAVTANTYTSDAAWEQAAVAGLTDIGYDSQTVSNALGAYLTNTPVTAAQKVIIDAAIGEFGPSPTSHQIILVSTTPPGKTMVKVPSDLIGQEQEAAFGILSAAGLKPKTTTPAEKGKVLYVQTVNPAQGSSVTPGSTVTVSSKVKTTTK